MATHRTSTNTIQMTIAFSNASMAPAISGRSASHEGA